MKRRIRALGPNTRVRLIVDGFAVYCKVKDIASHEGIRAIDEINQELKSGVNMTGKLSQVGKYQIQVNW